RRAGPRTAAIHALAATRVDPGRAGRRRAAETGVPAVRHPFADIAGHVVKAECIRREAADRRRPPEAVAVSAEGVAPAPALRRHVAAAGEVLDRRGRRAVAPRVARLGTG